MPDRVQRAADYASKLRRNEKLPFMRSVFKAADVFKLDWHEIRDELAHRSADVRRQPTPMLEPTELPPEEEPAPEPEQQELELGEPEEDPGSVRDYVLRALRN